MSVEVLIEIPKGSRNKYEFDEKSGRLKLDRVLRSSVAFPADYGFVPETKGNDGDPLDVMIITRFPLIPGSLVNARPIGLFKMIDKGEHDEKIIAVPEDDFYYDSWKELEDVPEPLRLEIEQFFLTYKVLEKKVVSSEGWGSRAEAEEMVKKAAETKE
ncbi:MAG: inorganic diphosphatase [Patescibacteria group bacterium]|nr:inorganic diphosphatase [Patescibacteria group bacterium]MDE2144531.1 inorganic diphosphatase [Patescibacteria group bacterium]